MLTIYAARNSVHMQVTLTFQSNKRFRFEFLLIEINTWKRGGVKGFEFTKEFNFISRNLFPSFSKMCEFTEIEFENMNQTQMRRTERSLNSIDIFSYKYVLLKHNGRKFKKRKN